jgi:hypothetical protein
MGKTIDVDGGSPQGWPPQDGGKGGGGGGMSDKFKYFGGGGGKPPIIVTNAAAVFGIILVVALLMAASGKLGFANIQPEEVAVVVNYLNGNEEVITTPGYKIYIPFIQEIYTFDRTTQEFTMEGNQYRSTNQVPRLTVRALDGSNFWFDSLSIQYELIPGEAATIVNDSGIGDSFKDEWIKTFARSILRDEFGRYTAVQAANPMEYAQAPSDAAASMNELLRPHGINIVRIVTPNPKFDPDYEQAIETRKEADQEVEELIARAEQLKQVREQRLAAVRKEKDVEMQNLVGDLVAKLRVAEVDAIDMQRSADAYATRRIGEGNAKQAELLANARGLVAKYTKEAEGIESRALALEQRGEVVVREALIRKLLSIQFTLVPYSRDPVPKRLEHSNAPSREAQLDADSRGGL